MKRPLQLLVVWLGIGLGLAQRAVADPPATGVDVATASRWSTETVTRKDGQVHRGLILHEGPSTIDLVEIRIKPGRPMYFLVRHLPREVISKIDRLDAANRKQLADRVSAYRNRIRILAAQRSDVKLAKTSRAGTDSLHYAGPWFTLTSRTTESATREAIVRLEQVFAGYRTFLRPRIQPTNQLQIIILGSDDEYRSLLKRRGLDIQHPAFFDPKRNEIIVGGQLATFVRHLEKVRAHHRQLRSQQAELMQKGDADLEKMARTLLNQGVSSKRRGALLQTARQQLLEKRQSVEREISLANTANDQRFQQMFSQLYHEAFHAYLGNYVLRRAEERVPRWLNEGLALIFETGRLEAGTLRVDAPHPRLLQELQNDLRGAEPLRLIQVLQAPASEFLVGHKDTTEASSRLYRYSWGLAYYLTFSQKLLDSPAMNRYVREIPKGQASGEQLDAVQQFEQLVGMSLPKFEARWRLAILAMKDDRP